MKFMAQSRVPWVRTRRERNQLHARAPPGARVSRRFSARRTDWQAYRTGRQGTGLRFSREYDVRRGRRRHMLGARITQRRQVEPRKEMLATPQQDRRDRDMHLVDEPRLEIL